MTLPPQCKCTYTVSTQQQPCCRGPGSIMLFLVRPMPRHFSFSCFYSARREAHWPPEKVTLCLCMAGREVEPAEVVTWECLFPYAFPGSAVKALG